MSILYQYAVTASEFELSWRAINAGAMQVDGHRVALHGSAGYPFQSHRFVLVATSPDGSLSSITVVNLVMRGDCALQVNDQAVIKLSSAACLRSSAASVTPAAEAASATPAPTTPTGSHAETAVPRATTTGTSHPAVATGSATAATPSEAAATASPTQPSAQVAGNTLTLPRAPFAGTPTGTPAGAPVTALPVATGTSTPPASAASVTRHNANTSPGRR
jgi:hypothetical protein